MGPFRLLQRSGITSPAAKRLSDDASDSISESRRCAQTDKAAAEFSSGQGGGKPCAIEAVHEVRPRWGPDCQTLRFRQAFR
jgi:hypothetical protein